MRRAFETLTSQVRTKFCTSSLTSDLGLVSLKLRLLLVFYLKEKLRDISEERLRHSERHVNIITLVWNEERGSCGHQCCPCLLKLQLFYLGEFWFQRFRILSNVCLSMFPKDFIYCALVTIASSVHESSRHIYKRNIFILFLLLCLVIISKVTQTPLWIYCIVAELWAK